jgi:PhzF family phenazine biosynthesis protein
MSQRRCRLFHVDAFTRERFRGNPAVVVLDADDLSEDEMQTIATEVNGETAFVLEADSGDHDMQVKFFTPRHEVPFVGHATVAAQYVRATTQGAPKGKLRQKTGTGIVEVEVTEAEGDYRIAITQSPPSFGPIVPEHHRRQVLDCPLQIMTKGTNRVLIGLKSPDLLNSIKPDLEELTRLTPHVGAEGYFVFALTETNGSLGTVSRMFCPALGIPEDPVSGNAHGMLGVYLINQDLLTPKDGVVAFRGHQGQWVRRAGIVDVEVETSGKVAQAVRIVGDAVIVYESERKRDRQD